MQKYKITVKIGSFEYVKIDSNFRSNNEYSEKVIYKIYFSNFNQLISDLFIYLNSAERRRAERFHKTQDTKRFIISRSILKFVLSAHAKIDVKNITLDYHSNKKPYLASHPKLFFNVSHSEDYAVIVISNNEVGIDIEHISDDFDFTNLLPTIFNDNEILAIQNAENKKHAFYTSWTRKEAFVKALGKGIDDSFKNIPCLDGQHNLDFSLTGSAENWQIDSFEIAKNYICAVAYIKENDSKNIEILTIPNTMDGLLKLIKHQE